MGRALYLYGRSGLGKSTCIERLLSRSVGMDSCYQPLPGAFYSGDFNPKYKIVLLEESDFDRFQQNYSQLNRVMEGRSLVVGEKFCSRGVLKVQCPVLFAYNPF